MLDGAVWPGSVCVDADACACTGEAAGREGLLYGLQCCPLVPCRYDVTAWFAARTLTLLPFEIVQCIAFCVVA